MKRILFTIMISIVIISIGKTQDVYTPKKAVKAAFFDKSPALRDITPIQPQQIDNSWKDGIIENETVNLGKNKNKNTVTDPYSVQKNMGPTKTKGPIVNVNGTGNVNGVYPPDTDGEVGPNHFFQMINLSFAIYDKQGTKLYGPVANSTLWSGFPGPWSGTNDGDPIILYDELADRWVASQFAVWTSNNKYYELIAVSETGDPLGEWYRYAFEFDDFPDYPKLSVWTDGYYATFHMFSGNYLGMAAVAFERDKMLIGDSDAQMIYFGEYGTRFGYLPADIDGVAPPPGTPCNFIGINFNSNQNMEVWKMQPDWDNTANSTYTYVTSLNTAAFNSSISGIPQPGTSMQLDAFSNVLMFRLPFRNFGTHHSIVANHAVKVGGITGIRWYELRDEGTGWEIYQEGTYQPDNEHRWLGSIAMGADGSIALGYSVSSSTTYPSIRYTGQTPGAPLNEMNVAEIELVAGLSSQTGINRWGDYSCMTPDPSEDGVFWFTTEFMKSSGWGTRISSFDFDALQPPTAFAGEDETICSNTLFETSPSAFFYSSVHWETSGDGIFQNANILEAKYLRGNNDIANGGVTLTLTAYGFEPGWEASDDIFLTINDEPEANAGQNFTILSNEVAMLEGLAENYSSVEWSTNGDGAFNNSALLDAIYTPGANDISSGQVQLTLTAYPIEPCEEDDSDNLSLTIDLFSGMSDSRQNEFHVNINPNPSKGIFSLEVSGNSADIFSIKVNNLMGEEVYSSTLKRQGDFTENLDLTNLPQGIYILDLKADKFSKSAKIIIE
ncbi:MAG: T9SS type A sorting domain-containing protein [Bacteroidales bacterium]